MELFCQTRQIKVKSVPFHKWSTLLSIFIVIKINNQKALYIKKYLQVFGFCFVNVKFHVILNIRASQNSNFVLSESPTLQKVWNPDLQFETLFKFWYVYKMVKFRDILNL